MLLISATWADRLEKLARDLGSAAWLAKPFEVEELLATIGRIVER